MPTLAELREQDEKDREAAARQTERELRALLANIEGLKRLRAITDEEWAAAEAEDTSAA